MYYHVGCSYDNGDEVTEITVTSKAYWNLCGCADDGSSISAVICCAMYECGASESYESVFELNDGVTVDQLLDGMSKLGFNMVADPAFNGFIGECD